MKDDVISRQAAIDAIDGALLDGLSEGMAKEILLDLPTVEPKKGCWLDALDEDPCYYRCSECGRLSGFLENFCPECGADMRGEKDGK